MRELLKAAGHEAPQAAPSLELNESHPLVARLAGETPEAQFEALARVLFEQALLLEGQPLADPAAFVKRVNDLIASTEPAPQGTA